jgi:hypothetical protein
MCVEQRDVIRLRLDQTKTTRLQRMLLSGGACARALFCRALGCLETIRDALIVY